MTKKPAKKSSKRPPARRKKSASPPRPPARHSAILANPDLVLTNLQKAEGKNFFQQLFGRFED
jgi:hypothetical protein